MSTCLADLLVDQNVLEDPGGRFHDNNERYAICFLHESWDATKHVQNTANSRTDKTGDLSEAVDGREGCDERSQRSSDCSVTALQVPDDSSGKDRGRCPVGAIVVGCYCESEEDV